MELSMDGFDPGVHVRIRQSQFRQRAKWMRHPKMYTKRIKTVYESPSPDTERYELMIQESMDDFFVDWWCRRKRTIGSNW
jgi:hypothetical protein